MKLMAGKILLVLAVAGLLAACSVLPEPKPAVLDKYLLEYVPPSAMTDDGDLPTLLVTRPRAHGAYDTTRIAYLQQQYGLRYYVRSRWADTPARMLAPILAEAMSATGSFQALYASPGRVAAQLRLDSELLHFHQDFTVQPSQAHITLRAELVDMKNQRVIATRLFDVREQAPSEDTYGGVQAANQAVARLMEDLAQFCVEQAAD